MAINTQVISDFVVRRGLNMPEHKAAQVGDTRLISVNRKFVVHSVSGNSWSNGQLPQFEFIWADYALNADPVTGYNVHILTFNAVDTSDASRRWYRFLRLIAGGATFEEARDIAFDNLHDYARENVLYV